MGGQLLGEIDDGDWVAVRRGDDLIRNARLHRPGHHPSQERQGVAAGQACDLQARQLIERADRSVGALSHDHPDTTAVHSPCDEGEHVDRLLVEPLQVVDHDQDGAGPADRAQQCVHPEADQKSVGGSAEFDAEHDQQRVALRGGQLVGEVPVAQYQSRSAGKGQGRLGLRADDSLDLRSG